LRPQAGQAIARQRRDQVHRGRGNMPFSLLKIAYVIENKGKWKTEILTLYEGSGSTPVDR
jgi:hypothetical protein